VLNNGTNADIVATNTGNVLLPQTPQTFLYDADGNLVSDGLWTNVWNAENRLVYVESLPTVPASARVHEDWSYLPDGRWNQRIVSTWNGSAYVPQSTNRFVWDGQVLLAVLDQTNGLVMSFMRGLDLSGTMQGAGGVGGLLAINFKTNGTHFAAFDGNGNVAGLVNAADGTASATYEYDLFGQALRITGLVGRLNPIRFSTQFADDYVGDIKYLFRDYVPSTGIWNSRDVIEENGGVNLYGFLGNAPINWMDRFGLALYAFDGTGNVPEQRDNVEILYGTYNSVWKWYENGVGDQGWKVFGSAFGAGGQARLEAMWRKFLEYYPHDDKIDIIGFSRGAAEAREFANMIYTRGDGSGKHTVITQMGKQSINQTDWGKPCKIPKIRFVGLFDTVGSFGWPGDYSDPGITMTLPPNVEHAAQAVARDEHRSKFPLTQLNLPGPGQTFQQQIFPGDHSDIGGGWGDDRNELSRAPLEYIWNAGHDVGVPFNPLPTDITYQNNVTPHDRSHDFPYSMDANPSRDFNNVWNGQGISPIWTGTIIGK
jgi:RHS repeat-associated protein